MRDLEFIAEELLISSKSPLRKCPYTLSVVVGISVSLAFVEKGQGLRQSEFFGEGLPILLEVFISEDGIDHQPSPAVEDVPRGGEMKKNQRVPFNQTFES